MSFLYVLLASTIEGLTEFLPISSTGHLIILNHLLHLKTTPLVSSFDIFIQLGAILAVVHLYYQELIRDRQTLLHLFISFLPTALIGFLFYPIVKSYLLDNLTITCANLFLGGIILLLLPLNHPKTSPPSLFQYFKIGLFQSLSIIPGTSRALMSILGGLFSGLNLTDSVKYSFLLAIPTIGAATALDLYQSRDQILLQSSSLPLFALGFCLSFLTAKLTVKFILQFLNQQNFRYFAYYRLFLSLIIFLLFLH